MQKKIGKTKRGGGGVIWKGETVLLKISAATGFCLPASCVYFQGSPLHRPFPHSRFIVKNKSCWTFLWLVLRANGKDISRGGQCGRNGGHRWSPQTSVLRSHWSRGGWEWAVRGEPRASPGTSILLSPKSFSLARHWLQPTRNSPAKPHPVRSPAPSLS